MRLGFAVSVAALTVLGVSILLGGLARASSVVLYANFEAGAGGWVSSHDLQALDAPPGPDGPHAAWVTAVDLSHVSIAPQYWLTPAQPSRITPSMRGCLSTHSRCRWWASPSSSPTPMAAC